MKEDIWSEVSGNAPAAFQERVRLTLDALPERRAVGRLRSTRVLIAACLAVILLTGTALATNFFGLVDVTVADQFAQEGEPVVDIVSLQGYPESNEYKATAEWMAFLSEYDRDGSVLNAVGNNVTGFEDKYGLYGVYSQEMADKLDEIVAKYDLRLHRSIDSFSGADALYDMTGTGSFIAHCAFAAGYVYDDGSFQFDGASAVNEGLLFEYQFGRAAKGVFTDVTLNVGSAADYEEWEYVTSCGVPVHLSLGAEKCILFADLPCAFVYVNILGGSDGGGDFMTAPITKESLESFADLFDLTVLG